jgi:murein DD-endopeptidase MepM/ murein hydrolase activator NlpD
MTPVKTLLATLVAVSVSFASVGVSAGMPEAGSPGSWWSPGPPAQPAYGSYGWPVQGPVIRPFEPPSDPYGPGHRGIDIAAPFGSALQASASGVVAFAGWVGGSLFISIDHPDGVRTTYSWLSSVTVHLGDSVTKGQAIGATGHGHPDIAQPHLHFGARVGSTYLDPMALLEPGDVSTLIRLAPLQGRPPADLPGSSPPAIGPARPVVGRRAAWARGPIE